MRTMLCPRCWGGTVQSVRDLYGKVLRGQCELCAGTGVRPDRQLSPHFWLSELIRSDTAIRRGIPNDPTAAHDAALERERQAGQAKKEAQRAQDQARRDAAEVERAGAKAQAAAQADADRVAEAARQARAAAQQPGGGGGGGGGGGAGWADEVPYDLPLEPMTAVPVKKKHPYIAGSAGAAAGFAIAGPMGAVAGAVLGYLFQRPEKPARVQMQFDPLQGDGTFRGW